MSKQNRYITTTLPYVNADPHLGHALEFVEADAYARYCRLVGDEVFFNSGTDEHGQKVYQKAMEAGEAPEVYATRYAERFKKLLSELNISEHNFIRTTDAPHMAAAQEFWHRCEQNGFIYKKKYTGLYCVADEVFLTRRDLDERGRCKNHPDSELTEIEEENYFFKFSAFQDKLLALYRNNPEFVVPQGRLHEIETFVAGGLEDFSISRLKERMPWGVPVPGDEAHVMYVWFDALVNYISAIGWPENMNKFGTWWPVIQFAGKDNLGHQAARWQAMLFAVGLPPSKQIVIHGFITSGGVKMSKSVGNVIDPFGIVSRYGTDALRYYLLREISPFEDGDFTEVRFVEAYNANLANGIGNLTSRIMKMAVNYDVRIETPASITLVMHGTPKGEDLVWRAMDAYRFNGAMDAIWNEIANLDAFIQKTEPFKKWKTAPDEAKKDVEILLKHLWDISVFLEPFMPDTAQKIRTAIKNHEMPEPLFKRIESVTWDTA